MTLASETPAGASSTSPLARAALVVAQPDRTAITAVGKDAVSWLNGLVTCDLAKLRPGEAAYGLVVEKKGRIRVDLFVVPRTRGEGPPSLALFVPAGKRDEVLALLDHHLIMEDVELAAADLALFAVHGEAAEGLVGAAPWGGRLDLLGHGGAVLAAPAAERDALAATLAREAEARGGLVADEATWERVRIEAGLPRFGVEVDDTLYPQEAGLEKIAVSFSKGCYLGQEVVYMLENRGHVKRKLVPLALEGAEVPAPGASVTTPEGEVVGEVKSSALGPSRGAPVAIAMIKYAQTKPGTELRVGEAVARVR